MMNRLDKRQPDFAHPLFITLRFLKVHDLFKLKLATQTHSHNTRSKFIDIVNSRTSYNLFIPIARTTHYGLKSVEVQGPKIWNMILPAIRNNSSPQCFKNELKS